MIKIAIVGRPNVGKSALFNRICQQRLAIVDEAEGTTRDRLTFKSDLFGAPFEVIDTGGIDARSEAKFNALIKQQAEYAIADADSIILVVDGQVGITNLDSEVVKLLWKAKKPFCIAVNKVDHLGQEPLIHAFHALGQPRMIGVSALQGRNIVELLQMAMQGVTPSTAKPAHADYPHVAIVGRANVGKSTLLNALFGEERCIVSDLPGTTRDSIDVICRVGNASYVLIDTAGIRRKQVEHDVVDKFATIRTQQAIERASVCLIVIDAVEGVTAQDKRIISMIEEAGKGCILLINKWDLIKGFRMEHCLHAIYEQVPFLEHCPVLFISALTGRNIEKIFPQVATVFEASRRRITTGQLNKFIESALQERLPPVMRTGKRLRIYYLTQVGIMPPHFVLFVNNAELMASSYKKYLYNRLRTAFDFTGVPLIFRLRGKPPRKIGDSVPKPLPKEQVPLESL